MAKKVIVACAAKLHAFNLAEQLAERGLLHSFFTTYAYQKNTFFRRFVNRVDQEKIPTEHIRTFLLGAIGRKLLDIPWWWNELFDRWVAWKLRRNSDYDVFVGWSGMCAHSLRVAKQQGKTTIVVRGSAHIETQNELLQEEYQKFGLSFSIPGKEIKKELEEYQKADYINVLSSFSVNTFLAKGFLANKLFMTPLGVNLTLFRELANTEPVVTTPIQLIYLGNLTHQKGIYYILEAIQLLAQKNIPVQATFIGGITDEITPLIQNPLYAEYCTFLGHIPQHELPQYLKKGCIGLVPSIQDGFAQVIPQLLASGIPVIASEHTSGTDIIQHGVNGYVVPIRSAVAIADYIEVLYHDPELLAQMVKQARSSVIQTFSWEEFGHKWVQFLSNI